MAKNGRLASESKERWRESERRAQRLGGGVAFPGTQGDSREEGTMPKFAADSCGAVVRTLEPRADQRLITYLVCLFTERLLGQGTD